MLTYQQGGRFVLYAKTRDLDARAKAAAMTYSVPTSHRRGMPVYMVDNPYAVLEFFPVADEAAADVLRPLVQRYAASWQTSCDRRYPTPDGYELLPFQRAGITYALETFGLGVKGVLIGDEPGLGKTVEAIGLANEMQAERVLAVVPGGTRVQWEHMVRAWSTLRRPIIRAWMRRHNGSLWCPLLTINWTILSYDLLNNEHMMNELLKQRYDLLVIDEAHKLKTSSSRRSRNVLGWIDEEGPRGLIENAEHAVALTGTPMPNRPREGYTLGRRFCWEAYDFMSEAGFKANFNPSRMVTWKDVETGEQKRFIDEKYGRLLELQARMRCSFMVRRLEKNVQTQVPKERYELAYVEPDGAIRRVLKAEEPLHIRISDFEDLHGLTIEEQGHIATLRRLMGEAKVPRLVEMIEDRIEGGLDKLLVFAFHRSVIHDLVETLSVPAVVLIGGMPPSHQERSKSRFINDPECKVAIMQVQMVVGLDGMQDVCSHALFAEASWVSGENDQALRRLKRYGQQRSVLAEFAVAPGSLDEKVIGSSLQKLAVTTQALDHEVVQ